MRIMLDIPLSLSDTVRALGAVLIHPTDARVVRSVVTDSREVTEGDLFFALAKDEEQRKDHTCEAMLAGAVTVSDDGAATNLLVSDVHRALLALAVLYKSKLPSLAHTVAVTGSVGKTTATGMIRKILSERHLTHSTIGNFNNILGLSLSVLSAPCDTEMLVLEMGMNAEGEIRELALAMKPDICVITNIGRAHIGRLGSREAIARAKREILTDACTAVICPEEEALLAGIPRRIGYSVGARADFALIGDRFISPSCEVSGIDLPTEARHILSGLCIAMAVSSLIDGEDAAVMGARAITASDGRARELTLCGMTVIDDSYNSSPEAVATMLDFLATRGSPRAVLLSDMLELGDMSAELHREVGERIARADVTYAYIIGEHAEDVAEGAIRGGYRGGLRVYPRATPLKDVAADILNEARGGSLLVKGSHATGLYGIIEIFKEIENDEA